MTSEAPPEGTAKKASLIATAINPGAGTTVNIATFKPSGDFKFTSDAGVLLWLVSDNTAMYDQIQAQIVQGSTVVGTNGFTKLSPNTVGTTPTGVRIGIGTMGGVVSAGKVYTLQLILFGASAAGTPTNLHLLWGSAAQPTGFVAAINNAAVYPPAHAAKSIFLADKALTLVPPSGTADKLTAVPTSGCTGPCFGSSGAVLFGSVKTDTALNVTGETILTVWLGPATAGAVRGFSGQVKIGKTTYSVSQGTFADTWPTSGGSTAPRIYRFVFATAGATADADSDLQFLFQLWSTTEASTVSLLHSSVGKPAGFMISTAAGGTTGAESEGAVVPVTLAAAKTVLQAPPGESAKVALTLGNPDSKAINVSISATGNASVGFDNATIEIPAKGNATVQAEIVAPDDAKPGAEIPITMHVFAGEAELVNLTLTLEVVEPEAGEATGPSTSGPNGENETAGPKTVPDEDGGIPSLGLAGTVLAAMAASSFGRRRRD